MKSSLGVALIGAGAIGHIHAIAYSRIDYAKPVVVCDLVPARAEKLAEEVDAEACTKCGEAVRQEQVDIVDVCVPTPFHPETVIEAALAGKNVICEKPISLTLEEADKMIKTVEKAEIKFMVAHCLRFWPGFKEIKKKAISNDLGKILSASAVRYAPAPRYSSWFSNPAMSGGAVIDFHIHELDYLNWLFGNPENVFSRGLKSKKGAWDHIFTTLSYTPGKGLVASSWLVPPTFPMCLDMMVIFEEGALELRYRASRDPLPLLTEFQEGKVKKIEDLDSDKDGYILELEYFANCVKEDIHPSIITPRDARLALETAIAAQESAENERMISLPL